MRRYVRDAGPLLSRLHVLTRADCTTRNQARARRLARAYDGLEQRIAELSEQEELASIRPELDGNDIMRILGLTQGPLVGQARDFLLELRINRGLIGRDQAAQELLDWAAELGISPPEPPDPDESEPGADEDLPRRWDSQYAAARIAYPAATKATIAGEWPSSGMKAAARPAPAAYVTLNIMS